MVLSALSICFSSCAYNVKKITPHFIDTQRQTCRKYVVVKDKPKVEFKFEKELPISECDTFVALPLEQALDIKNYYEEYRKKEGKRVDEPNEIDNLIFGEMSQRQKEKYLLNNIYWDEDLEILHLN